MEKCDTNFIILQCLSVRFEGFLVFLIRLLDETEDMPADVRSQIEPDASFHQIEAFLSLAHVCYDETLHA